MDKNWKREREKKNGFNFGKKTLFKIKTFRHFTPAGKKNPTQLQIEILKPLKKYFLPLLRKQMTNNTFEAIRMNCAVTRKKIIFKCLDK